MILFLYALHFSAVAKAVEQLHETDPSGISNYEGKSNNIAPEVDYFGIFEEVLNVKLYVEFHLT